MSSSNIQMKPLAKAFTLAVFLTIALSGYTTGSAQFLSPKAAAPRYVTLVTIRMVTASVGWGLSSGAILRTSDGGHHWTRVHRFSGSSFLGATFGPVTKTSSLALVSNDRKTEVLSTMDSGRSWKLLGKLSGYLGQSMGITSGNPSVSFLDELHGWALTSSGAAMESAAYNIYRTTNGGKTWNRIAHTQFPLGATGTGVPRCDCIGGISFHSSRAGWLTGTFQVTPNSPIFFRSTDAGRHWGLQRLPLPHSYNGKFMATAPPAFFGQNGVVPVHLFSPSAFVLYVTRDGGNQWSPTTPIRDRIRTGLSSADDFALDANRDWAWVSKTLYRTVDRGRHWQALARHLPLSATPEFQFLSASSGYAAGARKYILQTSDGGRTWRRVPTLAS